MPFGGESFPDQERGRVLTLDRIESPMPFGGESFPDMVRRGGTFHPSMGSPMPFGGESFPDHEAPARHPRRIHRVTNAFRRGVLSGPVVRIDKQGIGKRSPMPFGGESFPDLSLRLITSSHQWVTNAFRRGVLSGPEELVQLIQQTNVVTNAFRRGVLSGHQ